jgi:CubicO group peptidase (beta-lactamase class C family)
MEHDAYYMVDDTGAAWALGGLNATLRDYAKFGQLYLNNGAWNNEQIVPEDWVNASHNPDEPHLQPGENRFIFKHLGLWLSMVGSWLSFF